MTELEARLTDILATDFVGYGQRQLPCESDLTVRVFIQAFTAAALLERRRLLKESSDNLSRILLVYAERMASLAVRESSRERIVSGLAALAVEGWAREPREDLTIMSLLYDAAIRVGMNPGEMVQQLSPYATPAVAKKVESFINRGASDKSIDAMGYVARVDADGFRYVRTW